MQASRPLDGTHLEGGRRSHRFHPHPKSSQPHDRVTAFFRKPSGEISPSRRAMGRADGSPKGDQHVDGVKVYFRVRRTTRQARFEVLIRRGKSFAESVEARSLVFKPAESTVGCLVNFI